ncbi:hypothetical protein P9D79_21875, partial [Bacillus haynesii]|uniref:hypothetical protein n=1 Tax=Bacillus haynesii TaxID=1925021 RepID=UPI002DBD6FCF
FKIKGRPDWSHGFFEVNFPCHDPYSPLSNCITSKSKAGGRMKSPIACPRCGFEQGEPRYSSLFKAASFASFRVRDSLPDCLAALHFSKPFVLNRSLPDLR